MSSAPINKIIPYSVVDGPGNRVSVFVQKCNIRCLYCHNPETQNMCRNCGRCVAVCPAKALTIKDGIVHWKKADCSGCDTCIRICEYNASPKVRWMEAEDVFHVVKKSIPFIRGITVSGGECDLYPDFLLELFRLVKREALTCLMDCNGTVDLSLYPELIECSDGVMLDVKAWDDRVFQALTGASGENVKKNLVYLEKQNKLEELRIVCLPGYVDAEAVLTGIASILRPETVSGTPLKLIRFRRFGVRGPLQQKSAPSLAYMNALKEKAVSLGFGNVMVI